MAEHNVLTDPEIHEVKGAAAATVGQVPVADGAGAAAFQKIGTSELDTTELFQTNIQSITFKLTDISTAASHWMVFPHAADIKKIYSVIDGAITVADCGLSFEIATVPITSGGITITQSGSAAGDVDSSTPSAQNSIAAGAALEIITDGGSTGAINATLTFEYTITA